MTEAENGRNTANIKNGNQQTVKAVIIIPTEKK